MSLTPTGSPRVDRGAPTPAAMAWEWLARPTRYRAVRNLRLAVENGDVGRLASLLEPAVAVVVVDTGHTDHQSVRVVHGRHDAVALLLYGMKRSQGRLVVDRSVNGQAGLVLSEKEEPTAAITVDFRGLLVSVVWIRLHPEMLRHWISV